MLLAEYWGVIRRRRLAILVAVAVLGVAGVLLSYAQPELYRSSATVTLSSFEYPALPGDGAEDHALVSDRTTATLARTARSDEVLAQARAAVSGRSAQSATNGISVTTVPGANVITLTAASEDPRAAADAANAVATALVNALNHADAERLQRAEDLLVGQIADVTHAIDGLTANLAAPGSEPAALDRYILLSAFSSLRSQLAQVRLQQLVGPTLLQVSTAAVPSSASTRPQPLQSGVLGATIGLVLGIALAFGLESMNDSVTDASDAATLMDAPLVAQLSLGAGTHPLDQWEHGANGDQLWSAAISLARGREAAPVVAVTAADGLARGEAAIALARAFARTGLSTLLVCADAGPGSAQDLLALRGAGFAEVISGHTGLEVAAPSSTSGLHVLPAGELSDLAGVPLTTLQTAVSACQRAYGAVVIDAPALGAAAGALSVACDGAIVAVTIRRTGRADLERSRDFLARIGSRIAGVVTVEDTI